MYRQNSRNLVVRLDIGINFDREPSRLVFLAPDLLGRGKDHAGDHVILGIEIGFGVRKVEPFYAVSGNNDAPNGSGA